MAVSAVLFGTLLEADAPATPAAALREAVNCIVIVAELVHAGTDPETNGGVEAAGGQFLDASGRPLAAVAADLEVAP